MFYVYKYILSYANALMIDDGVVILSWSEFFI